MARVNVWLPADLAQLVDRELPGLNVSQVLQEALRARLECDHGTLTCARCATELDRAAVLDQALSAFYGECLTEVFPLVQVRGTAEGACQLLKRVAERHKLTSSSRPLPRPNRDAKRGNRRSFPKSPPGQPEEQAA